MTAQTLISKHTIVPIEEDSDLRADLGLDELSIASIAHDLWELTGVDFSDDQIERWSTVADVQRAVEMAGRAVA